MASRPYFGAIFAILSHFGPFFDPFWPFGWGVMAPSGSGTPIIGVKWGGESKLVGPDGPAASRPYFGAIFGHFEPFLALLGLF